MSNDATYNPQNVTVLIVDDHDPIRKAIKRVMIGMGFTDIVEAFDGDEALRILAKKPIDFVVLDLYMRNVSGFVVLEAVRKRDVGADIPVLVVTGEASKDEIVRVADMGADDYVLKPFQAGDLEKKVQKTLTKFFSPTPLLKTVRKAERCFLAGEFDKAREGFEAALKIDAESVRAALGRALSLEKLGREDEAVQILRLTLKKNHSYHKLYGAIADIFLKKNLVRDAVEALKNELQINPKQPARQAQLAKLLLKEGDAMGAVDHFRVVLQDDPKHLIALMGMGQAYSIADNLDKALYYFKRVRRYHPNNTKSLEAALKCAVAANEPRKAELFLKDEKSTHPGRSDTYILLAMFLMKYEREDEAMNTINELIENDPENAQAYRLKSSILLKRADFQGAVNVLLEAAKVGPSADIFCALTEAYMGLQKPQEATDAANKAISMNPANGQAFYLLADVHARSQQWVKAALLFRKAESLSYAPERCAAQAIECMQKASIRRRTRLAS